MRTRHNGLFRDIATFEITGRRGARAQDFDSERMGVRKGELNQTA